jgi:hypothetical protein
MSCGFPDAAGEPVDPGDHQHVTLSVSRANLFGPWASEAFHCDVADLDALPAGAGAERTFNFQTCLGRRRPDQLDHGKPIGERPAAPVLRDVAEQQRSILFHFDVPGG